MEVEKDQHFLTDSNVIKKLISALNITKEDNIIEIGSGSGSITKELAKLKVKILAFEIDEKFKPSLDELKEKNANLSITYGNALDHSWKRYNKIIGNIPFSVAESIIQKSIEERVSVLSLLISDNLRNTLYSDSKLGLIANLFFNMDIIEEVPSESLSPSPKVDCWIVKLDRKEPKDKAERILRNILTKNGTIKNAIIYSLMKEGNTKNQSKEILKNMNIHPDILMKPVKRITAEFIIRLRNELEKI